MRRVIQAILELVANKENLAQSVPPVLSEQSDLLAKLLEVSRLSGVPVVATNDVHYLRPEDSRVQDVLVCINTGKTLADENRMRQETDQLYLKNPDEMAEAFKDYPEALANTVRIAQRCRVDLDFSAAELPPSFVATTIWSSFRDGRNTIFVSTMQPRTVSPMPVEISGRTSTW